MTETALRKELHGYIEIIPARKLATLKPSCLNYPKSQRL